MKELLRKAGNKLREFDDAYAARVRNDSGNLPLTQLLGGAPVTYGVQASPASELAMELAKDAKGPASKGMVQRHQAMEYLMGAGMTATNAGYRYGLPAAGLTLAGKGLYDMTVQFGGQADQPEPNQLSM